MQTCPEVLKEPSKRRCHWTGVPTESRTLVWFQLPESPPTTCQATRPASTATASEASTGTASPLRKPKLSRRCRECVHGVDNIVRRQIVCKATHPDEDVLEHRLRYHLGPLRPKVVRARGARGPLTLRLAGTPERWNERNTNNRQAILCTGGFQPTDQISGWAPEREHTAQNGKCKLLDVR